MASAQDNKVLNLFLSFEGHFKVILRTIYRYNGGKHLVYLLMKVYVQNIVFAMDSICLGHKQGGYNKYQAENFEKCS